MALAALVDPIDRLRRGLSLPAGIVGMSLAHIGLGVLTIGITVVQSVTIERDTALAQGAQTTLGSYSFRFEGTAPAEGANFSATEGVQANSPGSPLTKRPALIGCSPSTSFEGSIASMMGWARSGAGKGSCTRIPSTSGSALRPRTTASSSASLEEAGRRMVRPAMPAASAAFSLLRT